MEEVFYLPALELGERLRERDLSSVEVTRAFLARIEELDGEIGAYITRTPDLALQQAKAADERLEAGNPLSRFDGVPVSIKDLALTEGIRTTLGSRAFEQFIPPMSNNHVELILGSGAVVLGKTNTPEFGAIPTGENLLAPPTRNPWDRDRTAGGSSSGAAAALAAGLCSIADGSDGGGSIRIPSAACGVVGIKPSRGRVSPGPLIPMTPAGLSTSGALARSVPDAAALLDLISVPFPGDFQPAPPPERSFLESTREDPPPLRIAWFTKDIVGDATGDIVAVVESLAEELTSLGHDVVGVSLEEVPNIFEPFLTVWRATMGSIPVPDMELLDPVVRPLVEDGKRLGAAEFFAAANELNMWVRRWIAPIGEEFDVLLSPVFSAPPPPLGYLHEDHESAIQRSTEWIHYTPPVNVSGAPAIAIPAGFADDMPVGVQLVGRMYEENTLVSLAAQIERSRQGLFTRPAL